MTTATPGTNPPPLPAPFFHEDSAAVRFWVQMDSGQQVGATVSKQTLHFRFHAEMSGDHALASYLANRVIIDAAVRSRVARGSIEPVMLREFDLAPPSTAPRR